MSPKTSLLLRHAEAIFWLARYMERIECLARVVDVHTVLAREIEGRHNWVSILQLYAWLEPFRASGRPQTAERIIHYAVLDERNPGSVLSSLRSARENARVLRSRISSEIWNQLNRLTTWARGLSEDDLRPTHLPRLCQTIREAVQAHTGLVEGTLIRDAAWDFYQLGRQLERGDQTTRVLDTKYHILLPSLSDVDTDLDHNQWSNLLRSLGAYHAFQRRRGGMKDVRSVGGFLLFDMAFPRSLGHIVLELTQILDALRRKSNVRLPTAAHETIEGLRTMLAQDTIERVVNDGLHEYLDGVQLSLNRLADALATHCFTYSEPPLQISSGDSNGDQSQSQGAGR